MSERMNKDRAREILKELSKKEILLFQGKTNEELHQALDIAIDSLDNTMTNREYMHLVGVKALFDTNFDLDAPLEKEFIEFLYMIEQAEPYVRSDEE